MNSLDIIMALTLLFFAYRGFKKGIFATVSAFIGYLISIIGAFLFQKKVAETLNAQFHLSQKITPLVTKWVSLPTTTLSAKITNKAVEKSTGQLNQLGLPNFINKIFTDRLEQAFSNSVSKGIHSIGQGIIYALNSFLIDTISFVVIFVALALCFRYLIPIAFRKLSPKSINMLDKLGGAFFGCCLGLIFLSVIIVILSPVSLISFLQGNHGAAGGLIKDSEILKILLKHTGSLQ